MRALVVVIALASFSAVAAPAAEVKAQALFQEGEAEYQAGKFDEALGAFMAAYDTSPVAGLLFNIGQCHRQLKRHELAVEFYRRYLKEETDVPNKKEVEDLIAKGGALPGRRKPATSTLPTPPAEANPGEPQI